jgi:hypothetical protein
MIIKFPDLNTLRLALTTGAIPLQVSQTPANAGFDDQDQCWVDTSASLSRASQTELKKFGVQTPRANGATLKTDVSCWAEILPLDHDRTPVEKLEATPVLFDLVSGEDLARLVIEILRLGNDRQGFRWLEEEGGKDGSGRALLRVVGPPYYSLLRAMDRIGGGHAPVAFLERAPRVWVELGYNHPLVAHVKAPPGKLLLIRPPRQWTLIPEAPYRDVYEVMEFPLPDGPSAWQDADLEQKLEVTPSLKPGGAPEGAELWVLRDDPVNELNRFVQNADDQMLQRLAFAVGEHDGEHTIVVRVRQSKLAPPVLVLNATGYKHYLKLPNLFLPVGTRLHPPLRRDQVRKLLAEDTSQVVWLQPGEDGSFIPQSLPEDAFRPLWDWIDYVLDYEKQPLQAWVQAAQFDFEAFVCDEDPTTKPRKPPAPDKPAREPRERQRKGDSGGSSDLDKYAPEEATEEEKAELGGFGEVTKVEPSELQKQLRALEEQFLAYDGGLDTPERQALWPQMARLNSDLGTVDDAGVCWMNAIWERDEQALNAWGWTWFLTEASAVPARSEGARSAARTWVSRATMAGNKNREVPGDDLEKLLALAEPATADLRALGAYLVFAATRKPPSQALMERLLKVSRFLEAHEKLLPVRGMWLAWLALTRLSHGDVLALARSRDRLLERLYHNGLRPEQDLPSFLRFAGQPTSQRFRAVRQWMTDLAKLAQDWIKDAGAPNATAQTPAYVDLIFAFGLARLGENDPARELLDRAKVALGGKDDAHTFLFSAFRHRVQQALEGKPHTGPLPNDQVEYLDHMERLARYVVDRLRKHSRILEPDQRINPYRHWGARISDFEKALADLTDLTDRNEIQTRVEKLLRDVPKGVKGNEQKARVLRAGLEAAPRVGEDFARKLLDQTIPTYDALPEPKELAILMEQSAFLEKALFVAGHFGRMEAVHPLVARFQRMLQTQRGPQALTVLNELAAQCFRGLRKLGMRDEIDQVLRQMAELVLEGQDVKNIDFKKREQGAAALRALLQVAAGWYFFGRDNQADPILQVARQFLLQGDLPAREQTDLAKAYAASVGQAQVEVAQKRLEEIFKSLKGIKDTYTTSTHFSVSQLDVVEAVVLAVVSDDFTMGTQARRWLDDDEFLVRRRIHRDLRAVMPAS